MTTPEAELARNREVWDQLARTGSAFARVATDDECRAPLKTLDSRGWLPASVVGLRVLCLASGGGWQSILYAAAGAEVTVVDLSPEMLALDRREAARRGLKLLALEASMDHLPMLVDGMFDIVHQPVSTCYVPDVAAVYREVARVLRPSGLYISQHKTPTSLQITDITGDEQYVLGLEYYQHGALPVTKDDNYREAGAAEYLHTWDDLVGGLCRAGFALEDLREPKRYDPQAKPGHWGHRGRYAAPYVRLKARRLADSDTPPPATGLWTPGG